MGEVEEAMEEVEEAVEDDVEVEEDLSMIQARAAENWTAWRSSGYRWLAGEIF